MHHSEAERLESLYPELMEAIGCEIAEQIWDRDRFSEIEEGEDGYVFVFDVQAINACNHVIVGSFWAEGTEFAFEAESGDNNGFVWRMVSPDEPIPDIQIQQTVWALAPNDDLVRKAILSDQGAFLVAKWDAFLQRPEYAQIPGKYGYDRHFAPGLKTERFWKERAAKVGFILVSKEEAEEVRARLLPQTTGSEGER